MASGEQMAFTRDPFDRMIAAQAAAAGATLATKDQGMRAQLDFTVWDDATSTRTGRARQLASNSRGHIRGSRGVKQVVTPSDGGTAMLKSVFYTTVHVSDQDRALDFYTNVVGFALRVDNPTPDGPRFLTVGVNGQDFQLVLWPGTPGRGDLVQGRPPAVVTIEVDDCRKAVETLQSRGVQFETDVLDFPWGSVAAFEDPDGNRLQLREGRSS